MATLLAARYWAPETRERITELGGNYADATGNLFLAVDDPLLFLRDKGADRDSWRGPGRLRGGLQGPPTARVVRALVDWRRLLERWSNDYGFAASNRVEMFLEPRGLQELERRLSDLQDLQYVITGSFAAERFAPYAPARLATIYVAEIEDAARRLGLRSTDTGANVALASGPCDVVFERLQIVEGLKFVAPSQAAVDLLTGPGRNPSEGTALLDWMESNEPRWRK